MSIKNFDPDCPLYMRSYFPGALLGTIYELAVTTQIACLLDCGVCYFVAAETASFRMPHASIVFTLPISVNILWCLHMPRLTLETIH